LSLYGPNSFLTGWTHVVNTSNGVLFYCSVNGRQVMADVSAGGNVSTRSGTEQTIAPGWTSIVADNDDILFYNASSGDGMIATIKKWNVLTDKLTTAGAPVSGQLGTRRELPGAFSPGWSNIVTTVDPPVIH
jgi:hypothetical protein